MNIIGVDPGKNVGLALFTGESVTCVLAPDDWISAVATVELWLSRPDVVVSCESYSLVRHNRPMTAQPATLEAIGALRYICYRHGVDFVTYSASDGSRIASPQRLRRLGWLPPGAPDHVQRAVAQVVVTLAYRDPMMLASLVEDGAHRT